MLDFALQHLAKVLFDQGEDARALALFRQALELRQAAGASELIASTELAIAAVTRRAAGHTPSEGVRR